MNETSHTRHEGLYAAGERAMGCAVGVLPLVALVVGALVMAVLYASIEHLGSTTLVVNPNPIFCQPGAEGLLCGIKMPQAVAMSVSGTFLLLLIVVVVLARTRKRRTLLMAGLFAVCWLALAVIMAILDTAITQARVEIPEDLLRIGTFVYSTLPALPLIPVIALAASAAHEKDDQYATLKTASGAGGMTLLKAFGWVAMFAIEAYYGVTIGVNPIAAVFAGLLNATAFTAALGYIETAEEEGDGGGVTMWGLISVFYALVMFAVAAEAIITFSKAGAAAGTATGSLDALNPPPWLESFAQWAFISSIGLSAMLIALTLWRKSRRKVKSVAVARDGGDQQPWLVRQAATMNEARAALRGSAAAPERQLPAGTAATMASESPAVPVQPAQPAQKVSENGTRYDETAEIVMPDSGAGSTRRKRAGDSPPPLPSEPNALLERAVQHAQDQADMTGVTHLVFQTYVYASDGWGRYEVGTNRDYAAADRYSNGKRIAASRDPGALRGTNVNPKA